MEAMMKRYYDLNVDGKLVEVPAEDILTRAELKALFPQAQVVSLLRMRFAPAEAAGGKDALNCVPNFEHVAYNLPRNMEGAPHYDAEGRPAFRTKAEVKEFTARLNGEHFTGNRRAEVD
jgi:hypothetical protein